MHAQLARDCMTPTMYPHTTTVSIHVTTVYKMRMQSNHKNQDIISSFMTTHLRRGTGRFSAVIIPRVLHRHRHRHPPSRHREIHRLIRPLHPDVHIHPALAGTLQHTFSKRIETRLTPILPSLTETVHKVVKDEFEHGKGLDARLRCAVSCPGLDDVNQ